MKLKIFLFTLTALLMLSSVAFAAYTKDYKLTAPANKTNLTYTKDFYNELGDLEIKVDSTDNTATFPANTTISVKVSYDAEFKNGTNTVAYKLVYGDNNTEVSNGGKIDFTFATAASNKTIKIGAKITGESSGVPDGDYRSNITFVGLPVKGQKNYEFGKYNGQTLKWRVLDVDTAYNRALLVTENAVQTMAYQSAGNSNSWTGSDVRKYLNNLDSYSSNGFLSGFTDEEKAKILKVSIGDNDENSNNGTYKKSDQIINSSGSDYFFLLSVADVQDSGYLSGDEDRKCLNEDGSSYWRWWLRSPGYYNGKVKVAFVNSNGNVHLDGDVFYNDNGGIAVRPAVWIKLN